ncbi:hypothetical protein ACVJGD_005599 [Bradyrhizobium sp. USDA 10063]
MIALVIWMSACDGVGSPEGVVVHQSLVGTYRLDVTAIFVEAKGH